MAKQKVDLSKLPMNFVALNKTWFYDSKTGNKIHIDNISKHLPKEETILKTPVEDWTRKYYGNT